MVGPSILFGRVDGEVVAVDDAYIAKDQPAFSFLLTDKQYAAVLAVVRAGAPRRNPPTTWTRIIA